MSEATPDKHRSLVEDPKLVADNRALLSTLARRVTWPHEGPNNRVCALRDGFHHSSRYGVVRRLGIGQRRGGAGGLGILGAGSMYPQVLRDHIQKVKTPSPASLCSQSRSLHTSG